MMRTPRQSRCGIALIIVMIAITVLSILAAGFAYSMKVETKLAQNSNSETDLIWLGRAGVELARYVLAQQMAVGTEPYDALNQKWAGGPGGFATSNSVLASIQLENVPLGDGKFSIKITDLERKFNINVADEAVLEQALRLVGVNAGDFSAIAGSILDWIDRDENTHIGGTESDYYQGLTPAYFAKNQPIDDLSELLLIRGITPEIYWGGTSTNHPPAAFQRQLGRFGPMIEPLTFPVGLVELFTPMSSGRINLNTASLTALQMIPFVDEVMASKIIEFRSGADGVSGTEDDTPIGGLGLSMLDVLRSAGFGNQAAQTAARFCDVRSRTFEVQVDTEIAGCKRQFMAVLGRNSPREVQILSFFWK